MIRERLQETIALRRNHPAWLLLASRTGPLVLAALQSLLEERPGGIEMEAAVEHLAAALAEYANDPEFDPSGDLAGNREDNREDSRAADPVLAARRELRLWIKRELIVERNGQLLATDALQRAFHFLESLEMQAMTSTASRLATVQHAIEHLEAQLSPHQESRAQSLRDRIETLHRELAEVLAGRFEILDGAPAEEGIREVYQLAVSLQADFRRVEDSYRDADQTLRQRLLSERQNRGAIVEQLLGGHAALLQTPEGQVFESFHQQLVKSAELERMKGRLRSILANANADRALQRKQKADLQQLVSRLVEDSERVIQARARSERDVRSFLKSGLAEEQLRVGALLQDLFQAALEVDWQSQKLRRTPSPLPPVAVGTPHLPLLERLLVKQIGDETSRELDLTPAGADPAQMDEEFWRAFHCLDRAELFASTLASLRDAGRPLTIGELAQCLPPTHDLETFAYWLAMARQAGAAWAPHDEEAIELTDEQEGTTRFVLPRVRLAYESASPLDPGSLE